MTERTMPKPGDVVAGKYEIEEIVGEGGMGAVFAARHQLTDKRVAIKWMRPELASEEDARERFVREARAAGRIDHPNVVDIYDVGEHEGAMFLVMELLRGESFNDRIERGDLKADQVVQILLPAMRGVAAAHQTGVVHRDLKPENIFLCRGPDGSYRGPKVLDFGISKVTSQDGSSNHRLTKSGVLIGTPYYMAPEQIRGKAVDRRADIYAFGVILYEALTGRMPFHAESYGGLVLEIANGTAPRPSDLNPQVPLALEAVILKAMARDPDARYPDIESLAMALEPFSRGVSFKLERSDPTARRISTGMHTPLTSDQPVRLPIKRSARRIAVAAVLLAVGAAIAAVNLSGGREAEGAGAPAAAAHEPGAVEGPRHDVSAVGPAPESVAHVPTDAGAGKPKPTALAAEPAARDAEAAPTAPGSGAAAGVRPRELRREERRVERRPGRRAGAPAVERRGMATATEKPTEKPSARLPTSPEPRPPVIRVKPSTSAAPPSPASPATKGRTGSMTADEF